MLVVHPGGIDLGVHPSCEIIRDVKLDLLHLGATFSGIIVVWSDIVMHKVWW